MTKLVAALFVQPDGIYSTMPEVDCWPESRDARTYAGDLPVVAHPPCATWGRYAHWTLAGKGNDKGCFVAALDSVRRCGGVLEHPHGSAAWSRFGLPLPLQGVDAHGGWTLAVLQHWWGHEAIKPTWLYLVGAECVSVPAHALRAVRPCQNLSKRQRAATPPGFARWLVDLAAAARPPASVTP